MSEAEQEELGEKENDTGDGEKEEGVAEVGYADRRLGGWCALGVREEEGLVSGLTGGRKTGTVTAGSSEEKGRTD
jgi:hypothetical protein